MITAGAFAKWSVVAIVALSALILASRMRKGGDAADVTGTMIGLLLDAWIIVAVCVWWHP